MKLTLQHITFVSLIVLSLALAPEAHAQGGIPLWTNLFPGQNSISSITVDKSGNLLF